MDAARPHLRLRRCLSRTGFESPYRTRREKQKGPIEEPFYFTGGEGGIRTHEGLQTLAGFQDQCIRPLCHLSGAGFCARIVLAPAAEFNSESNPIAVRWSE